VRSLLRIRDGDVDAAVVGHVSGLAMLQKGNSQTTTRLQADVLRILQFAKAVQSTNTRGVQPLISLVEEQFVSTVVCH
jgi:hypothetical protein